MINWKHQQHILRLFFTILIGICLLVTVLVSEQSVSVQAEEGSTAPDDASAISAVTFTKVDSLVNDRLGNGAANPGDTIRYTLTLSNATMSDMTNVVLSDTLDSNVTLVPNSLSTTPIAFDDTAVTTENNNVNITLTGSDPDGDTLTFSIVIPPLNGLVSPITPLSATSAQVTFTPSSGFTGSTSFTFQVEDDNGHTDIGTINVTVNPAVNNPPTLDLDGNDSSGAGGANYNTAFVEDGGAVPVGDTDVTITDDGGTLVSAVFALTNHPDGSSESLSVNGALPGGLSATIDPTGFVITITGSTTPANYQTAIRQVEYNNSSDTPTETNRAVTVIVNDGTNDSNTATATITVTAANDTAVLDLDADDSSGATGSDVNVSFTEDGGAVLLSNGISITDVDDTDLETAVITLTNVLDGVNETLSVNSALATGFGINVAFGSNNQSITLTGTATLDEYRQVLETITYNNADNNPDATTRTVTFVVNDGSSDSNTATAHIAITPVNDPPGATNDTYNNVVGNTLFAAVSTIIPPAPVVTVTGSVLDNDSDPEMGTLSIDSFDNSSAQGGTVVMQTDGTFTYLPPLGFEGADSFTYTVTDGDQTQTATVNLTVTDVVWYIDNTAAGGGDGRSQTPFNTLSAFNAVQSAGGANDPEAGDYIFIYEGTGNSTNLNVGITLKNNQQLIGQGVDLIVGANTLVTKTTNPVITSSASGITLASGNTIRGITVNGTTGAGITGSSVGNLTVSDTAVTNAAGPAVNLANGALSATFTTLSSTGSASQGINLNTVSGSFTVSGNTTIANTTGEGIRVLNSTGLTADFGSTTITNAGTDGVDLSSSTGSNFTFDTLNITTDGTGGVGLLANNAGTLTITGATNTINVSNETAVNLTNTTIGAGGITFQSISASGAANGIILNNTGSGAFTVTGTGTTDGSGGTIQNITTRGASFINTQNVSLSNMTFNNASTTGANSATCDALVNSGCNAAIHLENSSNIDLTNVDISTTAQQGINGLNVTDFDLVNSTATACGNEVNEGCLRMRNLSGTALISNTNLSFAAERVAQIENTSQTLNLTVTNSTFRDTQSSGLGADGLEVTHDGNSNATIDIVNSSFLRNRTNGLQVFSEDTSFVSLDVTGSTFDRGTGIGIGMDLAADDTAMLHFNIIGNPLINSRGSNAVNIFSDGSATVQGRVNDNPNIQAGGSTSSGFGIAAQANTNSTMKLEINKNIISNIGFDAGIRVLSRLGGTGRLDATISNNTITVDPTNSLYDIWVQAQDSNTTCANVTNNVVSGTAIAAFRARTVDTASTVILQGNGATATAVWDNNGNTPTGSVSSSHNGTLTLGGTCNTVTHPEMSLTTANAPTAANQTANGNLVVPIGTLPAGKAMTVSFDVTINTPFPNGVTQISNQASVSAAGSGVIVSDDPDTATPNDPTVTTVSVITTTFLPVVFQNYAALPDLVVKSLTASGSTIAVVIENVGETAVTDEFWVDLYINPQPAPTAVNQTWPELSKQGVVWGVTQSALPLEPGETLTLTIGDAYYQPGLSNFSGSITPGTPVYAQVDSANAVTTYGAVFESHEFYNTAYNNISSITATSLVSVSGGNGWDTAVPATSLPVR